MRHSLFLALSAGVVLCGVANGSTQIRQPIPIEVAAGRKTLNAAPPSVSSDGELMAMTVTNGTKARPSPPKAPGGDWTTSSGIENLDGFASELWIVDLKTGTRTILEEGKSSNGAPSWSPDGKRLAFLSERDGLMRLWLWERATGRVRRISDIVVREWGPPAWSADGRRVYAKVLPEDMPFEQVLASSYPSPPSAGYSDAVTAVALNNSSLVAPSMQNQVIGDLAAIDVGSGTVRRIVRRAFVSDFSVSPDERFVYYRAFKYIQRPRAALLASELFVVSAADGAVKFHAPEQPWLGSACNWAGGRFLACHMAEDRTDLNTLSLFETGRAVSLRILDTNTFVPVPLKRRLPAQADAAGAVWDGAGRAFVQTQDAIYSIFLDGSRAARRLPLPAGAGSPAMNRNQSKSGTVLMSGPDEILLALKDQTQYCAFNLSSGVCAPLFSEPQSRPMEIQTVAPVTGDIVFTLASIGPASDTFVYRRRQHSIARLAETDPDFARYELGQLRYITFDTAQEKGLKCAVYLPPGYVPERRYPLMVHAYPNRKGRRTLGVPGERQNEITVLMTRGFVVIMPDAPWRAGTSMKDMTDAVAASVDAVIDQGIADPDRLAIMGHSWGGYMVRAVLGQTTRFKAGISSSGMAGHPFVEYAKLNPDGSDVARIIESELSAWALQADPWSQRDRYIQNSPFFFYDRIKTPLMIQVGMNDGGFVDAGDETFIALRRLGVEVEYIRYYGEDHMMWGYRNVIDSWNRRMDFLQRHLNLVLDERGGIVFDEKRARSAE